jgi:hypothetical protein
MADVAAMGIKGTGRIQDHLIHIVAAGKRHTPTNKRCP